MDSLASKVVLKDALDKSNTCFKFAKVNFKYPSVQKHSENGDVGVAAKLEIQELVNKERKLKHRVKKFKQDVI